MVLQLEKKFPTLCWLIMIYIYYWKLLNRGKGVYQCIMCWTVWSVNNTTYVKNFLSFQYTKNVDNLILSVLNNLTFYSSRKVIKANSGKVVHVIKFDSVQCYCWWPLATCCDGWLVACENLGDNCDPEWKRRLAICNLWWQRLIWAVTYNLQKLLWLLVTKTFISLPYSVRGVALSQFSIQWHPFDNSSYFFNSSFRLLYDLFR